MIRAFDRVLWRLVLLLLFGTFLLGACSARGAFAVEHIDSSRTGSLTMTCEHNQVPLKGLSFDLWHVAGVASDGSYQLDSEFANCGVDLGSLELSSEWDAAAKAMYGVASASGAASSASSGSAGASASGTSDSSGGASGSGSSGNDSASGGSGEVASLRALPAFAHDVSGSTGRVWFGNLEPGLYLVSASELVKGKKRYEVSPCLVAVPHLDGTGSTWIYNVRAVPKIEEKDDKDDEPGSNPGTNQGGADKPGSGGNASDGSGDGGSSAGGAGSASVGDGSSQPGFDGLTSGLAQTGESAVPFVVLLILICASVAVLAATRKRK